jgi:hypothetical protein
VPWVVDFFERADGSAPVEDFLDSLPIEARAKALAIIQELRTQGPTLPFPYSSQVAGKVRELRTQYGKEKIRILYFGDRNRKFILLHGLIKNTDKLEKSDVAAAVQNMNNHEESLARRTSPGRKRR